MTTYHATTLDSPVGQLILVAAEDGLSEIAWPGTERASMRHRDAIACSAGDHTVLAAAAAQLSEYFDGSREEFDLRLRPEGTEFQLAVWQALQTIPYGETISYGEQARRIGRPKAARAVGAANGRNPISIVVPCHRVIGSTGALTGFGGGLDVKAALLEHETRELVRRA